MNENEEKFHTPLEVFGNFLNFTVLLKRKKVHSKLIENLKSGEMGER